MQHVAQQQMVKHTKSAHIHEIRKCSSTATLLYIGTAVPGWHCCCGQSLVVRQPATSKAIPVSSLLPARLAMGTLELAAVVVAVAANSCSW